MIIGTLTLLALLLGSGSFELFFIPNFENGVKEYVIEKDRQNEITADLKKSKKLFIEFNKVRKSDIKQFESLNKSRLTNEEDFAKFFSDIQVKRVSMQNELIDSKIDINKKINHSEWDSIVAYSNSSLEISIEKAQKNSNKKNNKKPKEQFISTTETISKIVVKSENQKNIIEGLGNLRITIDKLSTDLETAYANHKSVLTKKDASKQDLLNLAEELNSIRNLTYKEIVVFHMLVKENTNEEEWNKVMVALNKDLEIMNYK